MPVMPFHIVGIWFRGLFSIVIIAAAIYLLIRWYDDCRLTEWVEHPVVISDVGVGGDGRDRTTTAGMPAVARRVFRFEPGWNRPSYELAGGVALLVWATLGRAIGQGLRMLKLTPRTIKSDQVENKKACRLKARLKRTGQVAEGEIDPVANRTGEVHTIDRPNGSRIVVECYGPVDGITVVWTHGWGANSTEWFYPKEFLSDRFRLIVWDIPGLGLSRKPSDNDYNLETLAADLEAVIGLAGHRPVILVGHSIGGMITLTFCKLFSALLKTHVAGLVLVHTTYKNPIRTTQMASFYTAIEKPVIVPLLHLTIAIWPVVWLMNWVSYINGSAHRSTHKSSFSGNETQGQLNFCTQFMPHARPDVLARGMLGMLAYDATNTLARISVPTLVVVGDQDSTTLPEAGKFIAKNIPNTKLATLSPAKHMGLMEHHERFDRLVAEFASSCPLPIKEVSASREVRG